jgi:hypothetical protein
VFRQLFIKRLTGAQLAGFACVIAATLVGTTYLQPDVSWWKLTAIVTLVGWLICNLLPLAWQHRRSWLAGAAIAVLMLVLAAPVYAGNDNQPGNQGNSSLNGNGGGGVGGGPSSNMGSHVGHAVAGSLFATAVSFYTRCPACGVAAGAAMTAFLNEPVSRGPIPGGGGSGGQGSGGAADNGGGSFRSMSAM